MRRHTKSQQGTSFGLSLVRAALFLCLAAGMPAMTGGARAAAASEVAAMTEEQRAALSDVVARGRVVESVTEIGGRGGVVTRHRMQVLECMKGDCADGGELIFFTRGGRHGDLETRVDGEAFVREGDEAIVFLERIGRRGAEVLYPTGLAQGVYIIEKDAAGTRRALRSDVRHHRVRSRTRSLHASVKAVAQSGDLDAASCLESVRLAVAAGMSADEALSMVPGAKP